MSLSDDVPLVQSARVDSIGGVEGFTLVEVDPSEPKAANALRLDDRIVCSSAFPRTAERITRRGLRVQTVDASEVAKGRKGGDVLQPHCRGSLNSRHSGIITSGANS